MLNTAYSNWLNDKNDSLAFSAATAVLGTGLGTVVGNKSSVWLSDYASTTLTRFGNYNYIKAANYGYTGGSAVNNFSSSWVGYAWNDFLFGNK